MDPAIAIILAIIATIGTVLGSGAVAAIVTAWFNRPKTKAEAHKTKTEADGLQANGWRKLVDELQEERAERTAHNSALVARIEALEVRVGIAERDIRVLCQGIDALTVQLADEGLEPCWKPPEDLARRHGIAPPPPRRRRPVEGVIGP